jgi:hypothetical protein
VAGQVGLDYLINRDWLINMSVWYMDIDTDVRFKAGGTAKQHPSGSVGLYVLSGLSFLVSQPPAGQVVDLRFAAQHFIEQPAPDRWHDAQQPPHLT